MRMRYTIQSSVMTNKKRVRILHAIGTLSMGGAEFQCAQLANNCNLHHYDVGVAYINHVPDHSFDERVTLFQVRRGNYFDVRSILLE